MPIFGTRVTRNEDRRLLTEGGRYVDDHHLPGELYAGFARSPLAHGVLRAVDLSEALAVPGVVAAFAGVDLDLGNVAPDLPMAPASMSRTFLATGKVRHVGEAVAVVLAESRAAAEDGAEAVVADIDPLPAVVDPFDALRGDVLLFDEAGTNVCLDVADPEVDLTGCEVVVRHRFVNQRLAPSPLETQAAMARWTDEGRLEVWTTSQGPHVFQARFAALYGLDPSLVRVVSPDVGGGFGAKAVPSPEALLLPWLSRRVGRPVRWTETRSESMLVLPHGRAQVHDVVIGGRRDGTVLAYDLTVLQDAGAYPRFAVLLPTLTKRMHPGVYAIERTRCRVRTVVTNTVPVGAYRGAGRPEAAAAIERAMDLFAAEIGLDPADVRRRNLVPADAFPYTTTGGATYDSGDYERALDAVLAAGDYASLRAEQARRRAAGERHQLGLGLSVYVEVTAVGGGPEYGRVEIRPDGSARVLTGTFSHGQGHATGWAMLVADRTGIPVAEVEVVYGDTDVVPRGGMTGGSRSVQIGGTSVWRATGLVVEQARQVAARLLEAAVDDVVLDTEAGRFHVAGTPAMARTWADVAAAAAADGAPLAAEDDFSLPAGGTYPSGAHLAVVEVDIETGRVELLRMVAVDDAGRILNPLLAEGQVHGGLAQGIAQALWEEVVYDEDGIPRNATLAEYAVPSAAELPSFETVHIETPSPLNDLGAKGIGESGTIGATPAVQNAVVDALAHLGVRHLDMPATPERVWRAIRDARRSPSQASGG